MDKRAIILIFAMLLLSGCGRYIVNDPDIPIPTRSVTPKKNKPAAGKPVRNKRTHVFLKKGFSQEGTASWYGPQFAGKASASGEKFDMNQISAAHKYLPMNSKIRVTEIETGKSIVLLVKDRGPYVHGRIVDLSKKAAQKLGYFKKGLTKVKLELLKLPDEIPTFFIVQMGVFSQLDNAIIQQKKLVKKHFPAFILGDTKSGFTLVVGPYTSESTAYDHCDRIEDAGFKKGIIKDFIVE
ncbi:septal ring lytic transglycosylase RlpA family protein [Candidatus Calescamantes bacterium]|nr:septal ring lytic transglycosylase RlpA family protein [Candidatus Calescamantes bacterium]